VVLVMLTVARSIDPAIGVAAFARGPPIKDLLSDLN
jgi:hypothetical protein